MAPRHSAKHGFLERTTAGFVDAMEHAFYAEQTAHADGLMQGPLEGTLPTSRST